MAKVKYLLQGLDSNDNHQNKIADILKKHQDEITIYSAFLREASVEDIRDELEANRNKVTAVIGIRNGITSSQGLKSLLDVGVKIYVVDTGSPNQIFHPKTLVAVNNAANTADVMIGSANFTPGGFLRNMENSAFLELDLADVEDKEFVDSFFSGFNHIINDYSSDNVILIDTVDKIDVLLGEGRVVDEATATKIPNIGRNSSGKLGIRKMPLKTGKHKATKQRMGGGTKPNTKAAVVSMSTINGNITEVWKSKELVERDLTIPSNSGTNPTGSMLMKRGAYDIDQQDYFRNTVFAGLNWSTKAGKPVYFQFATAKFHFIIDGIDNGAYELTLKYDSRTNTAAYMQRQPNVHLSWGDAKGIIKNRNLLNQFMYLYSVDGKVDEFVIEIKDN